MTMRLIDWLLTLASRERWLLAALVVGVLPVALVLGLLMPLDTARRQAVDRLDEAHALNRWVQARQADMAAFRALPDVGVPSPVGAGALEASLAEAGLRDSLTTLEASNSGEIVLRFDSVGFTDLMAWIDGQFGGWGYDIATLRIDRTERPARVAARLVLQPVE